MCASCGCGMLDEDHGDGRNITLMELEDAAEAAGVTVEEIADNIQSAVMSREEGERRSA